MKTLQEFKTEPLLEEEKSDYSKFDMLVRAGLANKAQLARIHRILDKMTEERPQFSNADREIMRNLFNRMIDIITNNKQIFQQTRRVVREELEEGVIDTADVKVSESGRKVRAHRIKVEDVEVDALELMTEQMKGQPPFVLVLKRKAFRIYPNGLRIALYYNDKIGKYFSVPYTEEEGSMTTIQAEEVELDESVHGVEQLRKIVDSKQHGVVKHRDGSSSKIDTHTASAILAVHDKLNDDNKKKINNIGKQFKTY
jgi:hypothetical protein